jgi:hypothetical protein
MIWGGSGTATAFILWAVIESGRDWLMLQTVVTFVQAVILLRTAWIVRRYTEETRLLRLEAQRQVEAAHQQIEVQQRPLIIVEPHRRDPLIVRNIGNSAAININITVAKGTSTVMIPLLTHGSGISIRIDTDGDRTTETLIEEGLLSHDYPLFIDHDSIRNGFTLHVEYQNVAMHVYVTEEKITPEGCKILRS